MIYHIILIAIVVVRSSSVTDVKIMGSKAEAMKMKNVLEELQTLMNEGRFEELEKVCHPNIVTIMNGHKPVYGKKAAIDVLSRMEEWGPGIQLETQEYIVSKSNDLAVATGKGTYKNIEEIGFVWVFKKFNASWLTQIAAIHQWVKKEKEGESLNRKKREIVGPNKLTITGNNTAAITEAQKRLQDWDNHFKANDAEGLANLYTEDAVVIDNKIGPRKGQKYVAETYKKMMVNFGLNNTWTAMGLTTSTAGDLVIAYGLWHDGDSYGNYLCVLTGEARQLKFRYSIVSHETVE